MSSRWKLVTTIPLTDNFCSSVADGRSEEVDYEMADQIARKCIAMYPEMTGGRGVEGLDVVKHIVGLRPSRKGGCRLEIERMECGVVVHNYGELPDEMKVDCRGGWLWVSEQLGDGYQSHGVS
jgi:hypothetical protein